MSEAETPGKPRSSSRRGFLGAVAGTAGALVAGGAGGFGVGRASAEEANDADKADNANKADKTAATTGGNRRFPFYGERQAGIATPAQDRLAFAAFDVTSVDPHKLQALLATWAAAASRMTLGQLIGPTETVPQAPPVDTGEALGLGPAGLTITVGFGPSLFDGRFGLASKRPAALVDLPGLPSDQIDPSISKGDLCVQACSDDPQVAFHVIRNFARLARGTAVIRWSQLGFGRTSSTSTTQATPRNLMGFKDGTNNIKAEDKTEMDSFVWVGDETDQAWMKGGSYLVARRIRMLIETWDGDFISDQESIFGRVKDSGAPLTGKSEFDTVDLTAKDAKGDPIVAFDSHIRLASHVSNGGQKLLRRGYSYTDGIDRQSGLLDAGLFFIAFQKNPDKQFVAIQRRLGQSDGLNEYIRHTSSGVYAVPPGLSGPGDFYGKSLFG